MMRNLIVAAFLSLIAVMPAVAQNDAAARAKYQQAESLYSNNRLVECLTALNDAERLLGQKTPKVQYLKVLVYQRLAMLDITHLDAAMKETNDYLKMVSGTSTHHRFNIASVENTAKTLRADAQRAHENRLEQARLKEIADWKAASLNLRLGVFVAVGGENRKGIDYAVAAGTRSGLWMIGLGTKAFTDINASEDFMEVSGWLKTKQEVKATFAHAGFYQGIRILPRKKDWIKPMLGVRAVYEGVYSKVYGANQGTVNNMIKAGVDPDNYFEAKLGVKPVLSVDVIPGVMLHVKGMTAMLGMDVINTKSFQFGILFNTAN